MQATITPRRQDAKERKLLSQDLHPYFEDLCALAAWRESFHALPLARSC
jgi:hypothetical protein